jgi:TPR repeat protein
MYGNGNGVPQNYILAHMWYNLATSQGHDNAKPNPINSPDQRTKSPTSYRPKMWPLYIQAFTTLPPNSRNVMAAIIHLSKW